MSPVSGYQVVLWHEFAVATVGAAATLTGLIFVAISINLDRILEIDRLPRRAAGTLSLLLTLLTAGLFLLAPGQRNVAVGQSSPSLVLRSRWWRASWRCVRSEPSAIR